MDKFRVLKPETIELLIDVVRNYPEIYASGHIDYRNGYKKEMAWKKIKEKMGMDVRTLKIKWKNLRDTYRKHKMCRLSGNKSTSNLSNWVWADNMSFIEPYIKLRLTDASRISNDSSDSEENDTEDENEQDETPNVQTPEPEPVKITRPIKRRRQESGDTIKNIMTNINTEIHTERSTQEAAVPVPCDRTDMEFLGYASTVKRLSLRNQALVKLQITKILTRYQLQELSNASCENGEFMTSVQMTDLQPYFIDVDQKPDIQNSSPST